MGPPAAPEFVQKVTAEMIAGRGDLLPVSALPVDGTYQTGTAQWEKRNIAQEVPVWEPDLCIQCGKCVFVCPHAVIRHAVYPAEALAGAPTAFVNADARFKEFPGWKYTLQVAHGVGAVVLLAVGHDDDGVDGLVVRHQL